MKGYVPLIQKDSITCSLCEGRTSFCTGLISRKLCGFVFMFSTGFTSLCLTSFSSINHLLCLYAVFDAISSNLDEVLSINLSAIVFVFGDFIIHHKDWLTYSGGTNRTGKIYYNFSISNDLTQMVNVPTQSLTVTLMVLLFWIYLFISSDASICSIMAFPPLQNSDHVVVSVSIDFPSNSKQDALFHRRAYDCSSADWDSLCDHLRDISWENIFQLRASAAASEFCEWVQVGIDVYHPHCKYQVKPHSSP